MKKYFLSAAILASNLLHAATPVNGFYDTVYGGYTYLPDNISVTHNNLVYTDSGYRAGFNAGGSIGYKSNPLRYEAQLTYLQATLYQFKIDNVWQTDVQGYNNAVLGMANIYYDIPPFIEPLQLFFGVGLGYAWVHGHFKAYGPSAYTTYGVSDTGFAYQAIVGLTHNFAENYALNIGYRYIGTERLNDLNKVFQANVAYLEAVYRFDEYGFK